MASGKCEPALAEELGAWPIEGVTLTHRARLSAWLLAVLPTFGCGAQAGGQTGEETDGQCALRTTPLSPAELSPLGFSAEGEHVASFEWLREPNLAYSPESGSGEVTVRVVAQGSPRLARVDPERSAARCRDHLRIPVSIALSTAGGALDESFQDDLVAADSDVAVVTDLLPSEELKGRLAFAPGDLGERHFIRLELNLGFGPEDFAGSLLAGIESSKASATVDGSASYQPLPLACWGDVPELPYVCAD